MTKEYTGEEFRAPFCEALAKTGAVVEWESLHGSNWHSNESKYLPAFGSQYTYRFKPAPKRMVTMYDKHGKPHQLVAPEREALEIEDHYFKLTLQGYEMEMWGDSEGDFKALSDGLVFLTREDARAMADFQREQREGD